METSRGNYLEDDGRDAGKANYTSTGRTSSDSGQRESGASGHFMLRPSTNHGTLGLYNEE